MSFDKQLASLFGLDDAGWQRHANPWSGWSRVTIPILFAAAVWSRVWLGWWAVLPVAALIVWTWVNPRAFPPPKSTNNWMSKGVLGERIWLERDKVAIPRHYIVLANNLSVVGAAGLAAMAWGLIALSIWPTVFGLALIYLSKLWFIDRMVFLFDEMKDTNPIYQSWLR